MRPPSASDSPAIWKGNTRELAVIRVPSEEEEQARHVSRQREQLVHHRQKLEAQGRSLLINHAWPAPPRVRAALVELAWRMVRFPPQYPPVQKRLALLAKGSLALGAVRKKAIVAVARHLAVDLWRLHTGRCSAAQLGFRIQQRRKKQFEGNRLYKLRNVACVRDLTCTARQPPHPCVALD